MFTRDLFKLLTGLYYGNVSFSLRSVTEKHAGKHSSMQVSIAEPNTHGI